MVKIYVKCSKCNREEPVTINQNTGLALQFNPVSSYIPTNPVNYPQYWQEIDGQLYCAECLKKVRDAIAAAK
jgi:hypothetical protein